MTPTGFADWQAHELGRIEAALGQALLASEPADLMAAMRHAVLDGGKRLRPLLVLATAQAVCGAPSATDPSSTSSTPPPDWVDAAALRAACAVELIHAYSLVHDDMPCMDNDVLRRGKPTVHVAFGEATALLAGDALQTLAFELLCEPTSGVPAQVRIDCVHALAHASGHQGMAGGQAIDLASVGLQIDAASLKRMHDLKTGALLRASVAMGAICAQATAGQRQWLAQWGAALGYAFQVVDDILDVTSTTDVLGKTAGKDQASDKPTVVSMLGLEPARALAASLHAQAHAALNQLHLAKGHHLATITDWVIHRIN